MAEAKGSSSSSSNNSSREDLRFDNTDCGASNVQATEINKTSACAAACDSAWERHVQKQRSELMYELRKLQHGEKPVTGKDARQKVENFLQEQVNPSSNTRPERKADDPVVLEVSGLVKSRRVTSALGSSDFKRELENAIRGTIVRQEREAERAVREQELAAAAQAVADDNWDTLSQSSYSSAISSHSSLEQNQLPWQPAPPSFMQPPVSAFQPHPMMAPPLPLPASHPMAQPPLYQGQYVPLASAHQQPTPWPQMSIPRPPVSVAHPWQQPQQLYQGMPTPPQMPRPPLTHPQRLPPWQQMQRPQTPGVYPWQRQPPPSTNTQQPGAHSMEAFRQAQREQFVSEISELVQRRLVSETLEGDFRGQLEIRMQQRLESSNADGSQVAELIRSLRPSTHHSRNDFSHLGISAPRPTEGAVLSQGATNAAFESMRQELEELKNMVKMNFEMQLDIQRAIRQEVAAAFATITGERSVPQNPGTTTNALSQPIQDGHCLICLDRGVDCVLYQCGHMCVCMTCGLRLKGQGLHCPMCRAPIRDVIRAYRCVSEN